MCPGEGAGRSSGQDGPGDLVPAILARIAGGDLPAGAELDPARLALLFDVPETDVSAALTELQGHGAAERDGAVWRVSAGRRGQGRDLLQWGAPLLRAVLSLAMDRMTPAGAAGLLAAYDRYAGLAGDRSGATRAAGYRQMMERLAEASGSSFHRRSMARLLEQTEPVVARVVAHQAACRHTAKPEDELGRLATAMMQGNARAVSDALEDHLLILARHLDGLAQSRR